MDYLISPFGFPPVGYELPKEIDNQISTQNINSAYKEVYDLLLEICQKDLWRNQFLDQNRVNQTRFFSTAKYYYLSGFQIRGLAELHLALKYHLDTTIKLEESRTGYSGAYCFDLQHRISEFDSKKIVSIFNEPTHVATWKKSEFNSDLSRHESDKPFAYASYPLHYVKISQANSLNLIRYEDYFHLFKELGIHDFKIKKYVLSFFEALIFEKLNILRIDYSEKRLVNAKILALQVLSRFLCIETQVVCEYLEAKNYKWNLDSSCEYTLFFSSILNAVFGLIDDLIIIKEKATSKAINSNSESLYQLFKADHFYNFDNMENSEIVDQLNSLNYQPLDDVNDSIFNTSETDADYKKDTTNLSFDFDTKIDFPHQANSDSINFAGVSDKTASYSLEPREELPQKPLLNFETEKESVNQPRKIGNIATKISADDFDIFDMDDISEITETKDGNALGSNSINKSPKEIPSLDFFIENEFFKEDGIEEKKINLQNAIPEKTPIDINENNFLKAVLDSPYNESANIRIANAKGSVDLILRQKGHEVETQVNEFDSTFDLRSTETFITHDTTVKHDDIVKKVTESRQLVSIEEKRKAVTALHDAVKIKHPFLPRLTEVAAWTVLTKKWLHLLSYAETKSIVNLPIANRSTYFDLMCLKQNILKSWSKLESGYLQHQYLKSIAFDVFNTIYETWEYRQYLEDMSKTVIDKAVSLTKIRCGYNIATHETIEWAKITEKQFSENMFIEAFQYKFDIILPDMRKDKVSDLKTAFTQLYDNVQDNYMKVYGKYPGASHIFRIAVIIFDLLILNAHETAEYTLELQDDIFSVLSEFKADFHDARKLDSLNEDKFYIQAILSDIEPFIRRRISPEKLLSFE